jgi:hypothetical protein
MERCPPPDSAELDGSTPGWLICAVRASPTEPWSAARELGDAVRRGLPLPQDFQEFCRVTAGMDDPRRSHDS